MADPLNDLERALEAALEQRTKLVEENVKLQTRLAKKPDGLLEHEARLPLTINGVPAAEFIKRAYDLGADLSGPGRFDMSDPVQSALRSVKGWIQMASHDALKARKDA